MKAYIGGFSPAAERFRHGAIAALIAALALGLALAGGMLSSALPPALPAPGAVSAVFAPGDVWYAERGALAGPLDLHERHPAPTIIDAISIVRGA